MEVFLDKVVQLAQVFFFDFELVCCQATSQRRIGQYIGAGPDRPILPCSLSGQSGEAAGENERWAS